MLYCLPIVSKSFVQFSTFMTNIILIAVFTSDCINYSFVLQLWLLITAMSLSLVFFIVVIAEILGQDVHLRCLHFLQGPCGACKKSLLIFRKYHGA